LCSSIAKRRTEIIRLAESITQNSNSKQFRFQISDNISIDRPGENLEIYKKEEHSETQIIVARYWQLKWQFSDLKTQQGINPIP
jgi:hypothetical protein